MIENVLDDLVDLVIDLKCIESSNNMEELLHNLGSSELGKHIRNNWEEMKQRESYNEDTYFYYTRHSYCESLQEEIMTLLKGNI